MASASALSYLGWAFLPDLATGWIQTIGYTLFIRAGSPKPQPGTPLFVKRRQRIYLFVIFAYLAYSLYEAHWDIRRAGDHYQLLGVSPYIDERGLQSRFRRLTLQFHPDKLNPSPADRPAVEAYYTSLLAARDTLLDPARRFGYDRFGPRAAEWKCATVADYASTGLRAAAPPYLAGAGALLALGYLGFMTWGAYWRWLAVAARAMLELRLATRADAALLLPVLPAAAARAAAAAWPRPYLPFQLLQAAHKAVIAVFVALSRAGPVLEAMLDPRAAGSGATNGGGGGGSEEQRLARGLQRLEQQVGLSNGETARHLAAESVPFSGLHAPQVERAAERRAGMQGLERAVADWIVLNGVRGQREVQDAVRRVVDRGGRAVEHGEAAAVDAS